MIWQHLHMPCHILRAEEIMCEEEAAIAPIYFYTFVRMTKPYLTRTYAPLGGEHFRDWRINK